MTPKLITAILMLVLLNFSCKNNKLTSASIDTDLARSAVDSITSPKSVMIATQPQNDSLECFMSDTVEIKYKRFVVAGFKNDTTCFFTVQKENNKEFKTILIEPEYNTNNSYLSLKDENKDGYIDIVWNKKWQDHSYLFNPKTENFYEVGEFHDIDTLKVNGKQVLFNQQFPLLYLFNYEKDFDWMVELHSELFIIDSNYQKISFATLDNFASLEDYNINKCQSSNSVVVNCYVPPYSGKYGEFNIWNIGNSVDSIFMKANQFDSAFIIHYWINNYQKLLPYGQVFKVRRSSELKYFN